MAINYGGKTYNQDWHPINGMGEVLGDKDWAANAAWAAETQGQNPYTNAPGASPYDKTGAIPSNEPGSTLPKLTGPTRRVSAPAAPAQIIGGDMNSIQPWPMPSMPTPVSAPLATNRSGRIAAPQSAVASLPREDGPRRISTGLIDTDTPFLIDQGQPSEDDALAELAKLLQGVLR